MRSITIIIVLIVNVSILFDDSSAATEPSATADCLSSVQSTQSMSADAQLVQYLLCRQNKALDIPVRPVVDSSRAVQVKFNITLYMILAVDAKGQLFTTKTWRNMVWTDEFLKWNPQDFGNVTVTVVPVNRLWVPDIVLYNNGGKTEKQNGAALVYSNGSIRWVPPSVYYSRCATNMKSFPFDQQNCTFVFSSWMYDNTQLVLEFLNQSNNVDMSSYVRSQEWRIVQTGAFKKEDKYGTVLTYDQLTFYVVIQRRTGFYVYVLIAPSLLLAALIPALFWIPPSRPDRTTLAMTLFSSYSVLLLLLVQLFPTSASESRLAIYYCFSMTLIATSTLLSTIVIYLSNAEHRRPVPRVFNKILIQFLGKLLRITAPNCTDLNSMQPRIQFSTSSATTSQGHSTDSENQLTRRVSEEGLLSNSSDRVDFDQPGSKVESDWKVIVIVLDRTFFIVSTSATAIAIAVLFPQF